MSLGPFCISVKRDGKDGDAVSGQRRFLLRSEPSQCGPPVGLRPTVWTEPAVAKRRVLPVDSYAVIGKFQVGREGDLPHVAREAVFTPGPAACGGLGGRFPMAGQAPPRIKAIRARTSVGMWIVARAAGQLAAFRETAAGHQADGRESYGHGIFNFRLGTRTAGRGKAVAFSADPHFSLRRKSYRERQRFSHGLDVAGHHGLDVRSPWPVAAFAGNPRDHIGEIRTRCPGPRVRCVAAKAMSDGPAVLEHPHIPADRRYLYGMAESQGKPVRAREKRVAVLEIPGTDHSYWSDALRPRAEGPCEGAGQRFGVPPRSYHDLGRACPIRDGSVNSFRVRGAVEKREQRTLPNGAKSVSVARKRLFIVFRPMTFSASFRRQQCPTG